MARVKEMQGVFAHLETLHKDEDDKRRHISRCIYYEDGYCHCYKRKCYSSRYCESYKEYEYESEIIKENTIISTKTEPKLTSEELELKNKFSIPGTLIWNNEINDAGKIIEVNNINITIKYDNGEQKSYNLDVFIKSKNVKDGIIRIL